MDNNLRGAQDHVLKSAERVITDASSKVKGIATDVSENASEYASDFMTSAQSWLESNPGRAITALSLFAAVGITAYFLSKSISSNRNDSKSDSKAA